MSLASCVNGSISGFPPQFNRFPQPRDPVCFGDVVTILMYSQSSGMYLVPAENQCRVDVKVPTPSLGALQFILIDATNNGDNWCASWGRPVQLFSPVYLCCINDNLCDIGESGAGGPQFLASDGDLGPVFTTTPEDTFNLRYNSPYEEGMTTQYSYGGYYLQYSDYAIVTYDTDMVFGDLGYDSEDMNNVFLFSFEPVPPPCSLATACAYWQSGAAWVYSDGPAIVPYSLRQDTNVQNGNVTGMPAALKFGDKITLTSSDGTWTFSSIYDYANAGDEWISQAVGVSGDISSRIVLTLLDASSEQAWCDNFGATIISPAQVYVIRLFSDNQAAGATYWYDTAISEVGVTTLQGPGGYVPSSCGGWHALTDIAIQSGDMSGTYLFGMYTGGVGTGSVSKCVFTLESSTTQQPYSTGYISYGDAVSLIGSSGSYVAAVPAVEGLCLSRQSEPYDFTVYNADGVVPNYRSNLRWDFAAQTYVGNLLFNNATPYAVTYHVLDWASVGNGDTYAGIVFGDGNVTNDFYTVERMQNGLLYSTLLTPNNPLESGGTYTLTDDVFGIESLSVDENYNITVTPPSGPLSLPVSATSSSSVVASASSSSPSSSSKRKKSLIPSLILAVAAAVCIFIAVAIAIMVVVRLVRRPRR